MDFPVELSPVLIKKATDLKISPADIEESFIVGGGSGGQKINKTASCVQLKYAPSGTSVRCQKHREQSKNRSSAYKLLILKIEDQVLGARSDRAKKIFKLIKQKIKRSRRAKAKMLDDKSHRGEIKKLRKDVS